MAKPFGGIEYDFSNQEITMEELFPEPVSPSEMMKILWSYIRENELRVKENK
jgi:hypothetical protein